jgi:hypothetical protein
MSLTKALQHNQSLFIAAVISILAFGGITACHLTETQKKAIITTSLPIAEAAATAAPSPWKDIALSIISLLGSGVIVDNRRKDILIKRLKTENANALDTVIKLVSPPNNNSNRIPPLCNN